MRSPGSLPQSVPVPDDSQRSANELAMVDRWMETTVPVDAQVGTTGLRHASGFINEEFLARLRGSPGAQFYREVWDTSAVVGAVMFVIQAMLRQVDWPVESDSDKPEATRWKEYVESLLTDMDHTWGDFISEAMSFLIFGWSWHELVLKLRKGEREDPTINSQFTDGLWGIRKIEMRSQDTLWQWAFTRGGDLRGMIQLDTWNALGRGPVFIPLDKSLHFVTRRFKSNPEGYSLLRPVVRAYHFVKRMEELEAIGWQKDLAGMPVMEVPKELLMTTAGPAEKQLVAKLQTMLQQMQVDERYCAMVPSSVNSDGTNSGFKLSLMSSGGRRTLDTGGAIMRYNVQVMQAFGADFLQIGQSKVGTESLFAGKTNLFLLGLTHYLDTIETTINRNLIPKLMKLNGVPREFWPQFKHGKLDKPDLDTLGKFLALLGQAGLLSPNKNLEKKVLEIADLPTPDEDDLAIFDDKTTPTPADPADLASGLMSERQHDLIIRVNEAVTTGKMDPEVATSTLAASLGVDEANAAKYISKPQPKPAAGRQPGTPSAANEKPEPPEQP